VRDHAGVLRIRTDSRCTHRVGHPRTDRQEVRQSHRARVHSDLVNVTTLQAVADAWPAGMLVAVVLFGLAIGSFLNVVIVRVPEGRSLWHPRSACPGCSAQLAWHDNIPVLSFLWLRGRCRRCGMRISPRYPIVEGVTAAAQAALYMVYSSDS